MAKLHLFEFGHGMKEFLVLRVGAKSHHPLDAGPVIPTPVEQDDLSTGRKVRNVPLKIPLGAFALVRDRKCNNTANPRVHALRDPLDHPALASGVTFKDHQEMRRLSQ
jgi:hypothetical protein